MDFAAKAQFLTLDVITDIAFGDPFGDLVADKDLHGYIKAIEDMIPVSIWLKLFPSLVNLTSVSWIGRRVLPSSEDNIGFGKAMGFVSLPLISLDQPYGYLVCLFAVCLKRREESRRREIRAEQEGPRRHVGEFCSTWTYPAGSGVGGSTSNVLVTTFAIILPFGPCRLNGF